LTSTAASATTCRRRWACRPAGDALSYTLERAQDGRNLTFAFDRLGVRVPAVLVSPWLPKGYVEHGGANFGGEYSHTSILHFLTELWGIPRLTPRVAWSATFEHLFLQKRRPECDSPRVLPEPVVW
jgi:phospholipase C